MSKKLSYAQKFRPEWLEDPICKEWIAEVTGRPTQAFCKFCRVLFRGRYADIKQHLRTKKHVRSSANKCLDFPVLFEDVDCKVSEKAESFGFLKPPPEDEVKTNGNSKSNQILVRIGSLKNQIPVEDLKNQIPVEFNPDEINHHEEVDEGVDGPHEKFKEMYSLGNSGPPPRKPQFTGGESPPSSSKKYVLRERDECDLFCNTLATQMRKLSEKDMIEVQLEILNVMAKKRLQILQTAEETNNQGCNQTFLPATCSLTVNSSMPTIL